MNARDAALKIMRDSGMSYRGINKKLGHSPGYLTHIVNGTSTPNADTMTAIADVCGYDMLARKREDGTEIIIDPPERKE